MNKLLIQLNFLRASRTSWTYSRQKHLLVHLMLLIVETDISFVGNVSVRLTLQVVKNKYYFFILYLFAFENLIMSAKTFLSRLWTMGSVAAKSSWSSTGRTQIYMYWKWRCSQLLLARNKLQSLSELQESHPKERRVQSHEMLKMQIWFLLGVSRFLEKAQFSNGWKTLLIFFFIICIYLFVFTYFQF
jgi:hypothetical protein